MSVFSDGLPERPYIAKAKPDEYRTKTCGDCVRCVEERDCPYSGVWRCADISHEMIVKPSRPACEDFWSRKAQKRLEEQHDQDTEKRRKELWAVYADKPPVALPFVVDGFGAIPECPICGEMPYSTEQCHWCGQRFVQDETIAEYNDPGPEVRMDCFFCGCKNTLVGHRSKYNGHFHGTCEQCGIMVIE